MRNSQFAKDMMSKPISNDNNWSIIESLYDRFLSNNKTSIYPKRIPKIIHQVWVGNNPMPKEYIEYMETIKKANPDYWHKLWTDEDVKDFGLVNKNIFDNCSNNGVKSDIFRYEILQRYGGIYMDTDFIAHKSFDDLLGFDFFSGTSCAQNCEILNGLFGTIPNHPIMNLAIKELSNKTPHHSFQNMANAVLDFSGPRFMTKCFLEVTEETHNVVVLPEKYFYPIPNFQRHNYQPSMIDLYKTEDSYCTHVWGCSWQ